jgi:hypothetical protein
VLHVGIAAVCTVIDAEDMIVSHIFARLVEDAQHHVQTILPTAKLHKNPTRSKYLRVFLLISPLKSCNNPLSSDISQPFSSYDNAFGGRPLVDGRNE